MEQNILLYFLNYPENTNCFECGLQSVTCASVNNGIFLCKTCGDLHKQLSSDLSRVKDLYTDAWNDLDTELLLNGGNKRLWDLFVSYNMPRDANFDFKYKTSIGYYYRFMLMAIVRGDDPGAPPQFSDALKVGKEQTQKRDGKPSTDLLKTVDHYGKKGYEYTKQTVKGMMATVSDPTWQKNTKESLSKAHVDFKNTVKDAARESKEKGYINYAKEMGQKGYVETKKELGNLFGLLSKKLSSQPTEAPVHSFQNQGLLINQPVVNQPNPNQLYPNLYQQQQYPNTQL